MVNVSRKIWEIGASSTRLGASEFDCQNCGRNPIEIETECKFLLMWATQEWTYHLGIVYITHLWWFGSWFMHGFTTVLRSEFSSRVEIHFLPEEAEPAEIIFWLNFGDLQNCQAWLPASTWLYIPPKNTLFISCLPHPIQYLWSDNLGKPQANLTGRPPMMVARGIIRRMANLSRLWTIYQVFRWINPQCSTSVCNDCWLMRCFLKWKTPKPPNQPFSYWKSLKTDMFGSFRGSHFKKPWWVSIAN